MRREIFFKGHGYHRVVNSLSSVMDVVRWYKCRNVKRYGDFFSIKVLSRNNVIL